MPHHLELKQQLAYQEQRLYRSLRTLLRASRRPWNACKVALLPASAPVYARIRRTTGPLDTAAAIYAHRVYRPDPRAQIAARSSACAAQSAGTNRLHAQGSAKHPAALVRAVQNRSRLSQQRFAALIRQLDALSPLKVMERGYSVVYDEQEQTVLNSITQVQPGDIVKIRMKDGRLDCHVWAMKGEEHE